MSWSRVLRWPRQLAQSDELDVQSLHAEHGDFVWATLQRLGVRAADLEDAHQEVFVVVHRRLGSFDSDGNARSWLYGITVRVAAAHRRRAYNRRERPVEALPEMEAEGAAPDELSQQRQARALLMELLDVLDGDKRAVFVMFELEERSCHEIADQLGMPIGTVYSRLHAARKAFAKASERARKRRLGDTCRTIGAKGGGAGHA